jgi:hypothetical protein
VVDVALDGEASGLFQNALLGLSTGTVPCLPREQAKNLVRNRKNN